MIAIPAAWPALAAARPDLADHFRPERDAVQLLLEDMYGENADRVLDFIEIDAEGRWAGAWRLDIDEAGDPVKIEVDADWEEDASEEARAELVAAVVGLVVRHGQVYLRGRRGGGAAFPPYWN